MATGSGQAQAVLGEAALLHLDNHILVLDKPAGLLSQAATAGDDNILDRAKEFIRLKFDKPGNVYLGLVHRLDRNVSGLMIFARTSKAAARLSKAFAGREVEKRYLALVDKAVDGGGTLKHRLAKNPAGRGVVEAADGKHAALSYEVLAKNGSRSLLEVELHTGRKHQIRAQLSWAGMPLLGDPLYGESVPAMRRPALLAARLRFKHPVKDDTLTFRATLPGDLERALESEGFLAAGLSALRVK